MATSASAATVASAATMASAAAGMNKFYVRLDCAFAFLVEDVECRQAYVRNLLLTESDSVALAFLVEGVERHQAAVRNVFLTESDSIVISGH
jgi:hypothetical protein